VVERFDAGPFQLDEMEIGARASFGFEPDDTFSVTRVTRSALRLRLSGGEGDRTHRHRSRLPLGLLLAEPLRRALPSEFGRLPSEMLRR
jgi:hypothetical protein